MWGPPLPHGAHSRFPQPIPTDQYGLIKAPPPQMAHSTVSQQSQQQASMLEAQRRAIQGGQAPPPQIYYSQGPQGAYSVLPNLGATNAIHSPGQMQRRVIF